MDELVSGWETRLQQDLRGFADRGNEPRVETDGHTLEAVWTTRGKTQSQLFSLTPEGVLRWVGKAGDESYSEFLTSDTMADFRQLAAAITSGIARQDAFVASEAIVEDARPTTASEITATPAALTDLAENARLHAEDRTSLYFVKGDPGAGKTTLLREATALQAERYLKGESGFLFFYVSAQGRELSNLRDAFSGELDDLRAAFTRDAIATLARRGLLVPIVDGFDELLGTTGYGGAFSSLQSLLVELQGLGAVVCLPDQHSMTSSSWPSPQGRSITLT
jgi:hypothetical protein